MYKRILAAVDGSRGARLALDEAIKIAQASGAEIVAVFVVEHAPQLVDVGAVYMPEQGADAAQVDAATAALDEARDLLREHGVAGAARALDAYGDGIADVLARAADECEADLVVMGTHGRHGMRRVLLGSVAEALLRKAHTPVLLVRHTPDTEGSEPADTL
ncbi:universal stress protein [Trinickia diaoshuihuensis]|jgi:nucleotide-binding universal stress UspA family protein|uniref:universal stress protein n=1 Tax=Trinickia diaoshuihuensis TaxID=2292265 RepID=UPI000E240753|nr:universal stress protein [Trinickia diaoshuihuensis]